MSSGAVLWVIWLEHNRLCFQGGNVKNIHSIGMQIIGLVSFWFKHNKESSLLKLTVVLSQDVQNLHFREATLWIYDGCGGDEFGDKPNVCTIEWIVRLIKTITMALLVLSYFAFFEVVSKWIFVTTYKFAYAVCLLFCVSACGCLWFWNSE
jgi:hypothetical protein